MIRLKKYFSLLIERVLGATETNRWPVADHDAGKWESLQGSGNRLPPGYPFGKRQAGARSTSLFPGGHGCWEAALDGVLSRLIVEVQWDSPEEQLPGDGDWWLEQEPALGLVEFTSIPLGIKYCDQMLKQSPVHLLEATTICPGKFVAMIGGDAVTVDYALQKGLAVGDDCIADHLYIPNVDAKVIAALAGRPMVGEYDSLGVIETGSVAAGIVAADTAVKASEVSLLRIRLARELGGKAYLVLAGTLGEVEAGLESVKDALGGSGQLREPVSVPVPDEALVRRMGLPRSGVAVSGGELRLWKPFVRR